MDSATRPAALVQRLRARLGALWCVVILLLGPACFGVFRFGPRAALVVGLSVCLCALAGVLPRWLAREPYRLLNPGSLVTGLLIGLTVTADIPLYMVVVGSLTGEILGKLPWPWLGRNLFNPAALGRGAIACLEYLDPSAPVGVDVVSRASPLMTAAGGHPQPAWSELLLGLRHGAIGETSVVVLLAVGTVLLGWVVIKREAALTTLLAVPLAVVCLPLSARVVGHAPWALNPLVYLAGSSYLLIAFFYATDPVTTPRTRLGGILFGLGVAFLGVAGRFYYSIPGSEMFAVLVMNLVTPGLDRVVGGSKSEAAQPPRGHAVATFYQERGPVAGAIPATARLTRIIAQTEGPPFLAARSLLSAGASSELLERVRLSGLRGCGGAYFPVSSKWEAARAHPGPRVLVVNGQEGEPATFKDRYLMVRHPELVVEGALIAALAIEADQIWVVVDPDCLEARQALEGAWREWTASGAELNLDWRMASGSGLYVCGEETALLEYLEGRRGEPRLRPPFPVEQGLWGRPTVIHNVETLAWLPAILLNGPDRFRGTGSGHKLVSVSGAVRQPGLYEVPLGCTLGSIVELAGGLASYQPLLAYAVGGPSGGYLPPRLAHLPLEREALAQAGAMLGTGSLEVLDQSRCLVTEARDSAAFFARESCGRCAPCRMGTRELERLWADIAAGRADLTVLSQVQALAEVLQAASTCGLGVGAPTRILSVLRYWPALVEDHITNQGRSRCPSCHESG